ncbi:MAG: tetratricopeptide repeat protein [Cyanobacteria bacterium P01_G01_bin.19]
MEPEFLRQGIQLTRNGDHQAAIAFFDRAIASGNSASLAYYYRGLACYESGDIDRAIADYNRSLDLDPNLIEAYFSRARAFLALDNIQSSIIDLQVILSLDPSYDKAYKLRANICLRTQEYDLAIDYLKQAGKIYLARQDKESCRFCIARIRQIEQQKIEAKGGVTNAMFLQQIQQKISQGNLGEAFRDCNWLIKLDPYDALAYQYRGTISVELKEYEEAKQDLAKAARCFRSQGNVAESEKLERRCLELKLTRSYEQSVSTHANIPQLVRTSHPQNALQNQLYVLVGNWNIAQSLVERLMQRYPGKTDVWYWEKAIYDIKRDRL